jgi:uncharacterized membrane protein YfcA
MGTANMQARANEFGGEFDQVSQPGRGTLVCLSIPCIRRQPMLPWLTGIMWGWVVGGMLFLTFRPRQLTWGILVLFSAVLLIMGVAAHYLDRKARESAS